MLRFTEIISESKAGKNLHLEHIEDEIINMVLMVVEACNQLSAFIDMLNGSARSSVNMTVKWDEHAIFGIVASDGKFFVKKSVFNINPKLYKTNAEIDADLSGALNQSLRLHLQSFKVRYQKCVAR